MINEIDYDDNGNMLKQVMYQGGKIFYTFHFPPCAKRKIVKYNDDGSVSGESCEDPMAVTRGK